MPVTACQRRRDFEAVIETQPGFSRTFDSAGEVSGDGLAPAKQLDSSRLIRTQAAH